MRMSGLYISKYKKKVETTYKVFSPAPGSIILLLPPPPLRGEKKSTQGREFKVYKKREGKKEGKDGKERKSGKGKKKGKNGR